MLQIPKGISIKFTLLNKEIGRFDLADIPPAPRGLPQIEVAFDIDADGILHVSAKGNSTGKEQKIRIEAQSGLREEDIQKMLKDAELHAEEDKKRKEEVEIRNEADSQAFRASKALDEYKDKLPQEIVGEIQGKIDAVKKALEGTDTARIKSAKEDLERSMRHIGEAIAKAGAAAGGAGQAHEQASSFEGGQPHHERPKNEDHIEEAEVEIIDDKDK